MGTDGTNGYTGKLLDGKFIKLEFCDSTIRNDFSLMSSIKPLLRKLFLSLTQSHRLLLKIQRLRPSSIRFPSCGRILLFLRLSHN